MSDFPIRPFQDIIIAEQIVETQTAGGIILPESSEGGKMRYAIVKAVGPGKYYAGAMNARGSMEAAVFVPTTVVVGQLVCFDEYQSGGRPLKLDGKDYLLFREGDLVGAVGDEALADRIVGEKLAVMDPRFRAVA